VRNTAEILKMYFWDYKLTKSDLINIVKDKNRIGEKKLFEKISKQQ
jgi:hypothetical protein